MPRKPRMYLPHVPCHIVQRGHNRSACFFAEDDYRFYLQCLDDSRRRYSVAVHAYVLMTNHVHLLMTPVTTEGISRVMQFTGSRYVQFINKTYRRSGTLWEDRPRASLVQADDYLLTCYRYIELNPVRALMTHHPGDYPWSSYRFHAYGETNKLITPHTLYEQLGSHGQEQQLSYRELFATELEKEELHAIRRAANFSMPLGNDRFRDEIEEALGRKIGYACRGKPRQSMKQNTDKDDNYSQVTPTP